MNYKLKEVLNKYIRGPFGSALKRAELSSKGIPVYEQQNAIYNHRDFRFFVNNDKFNELKRFQVQTGDIIISCSGTVGKASLISEDDAKGIISQALLILRPNNEVILPYYLYYFFKSDYGYKSLISRSSGSVQINIAKREIIENINIFVPKIDIQQKIIKILINIDKKIDLNNQINNNLYELGLNIYRKSSIDEKNKCELKCFFEVITGKKDANESCDNGLYPFFTCSKQVLKINDYSFDGSAILLAGNGDFNIKVYKGKFDAYQRTYVLIPNDEKKLGYLYFSMSANLQKLTSGFRGSVIKFITKGMIENFQISLINDSGILSSLNIIVEKILENEKENQNLEQLRDTLLPMLMSGAIDLENIEI